MTINVPGKSTSTEHHSFWLQPETMRYIRNANRVSRIPQGHILQIILDYFRLTRKQRTHKLTDDELQTLAYVEHFSRLLPL